MKARTPRALVPAGRSERRGARRRTAGALASSPSSSATRANALQRDLAFRKAIIKHDIIAVSRAVSRRAVWLGVGLADLLCDYVETSVAEIGGDFELEVGLELEALDLMPNLGKLGLVLLCGRLRMQEVH